MIKEVSLGHTVRLCHKQNQQTQVKLPDPTEAPKWESKVCLSFQLFHKTRPNLHITKWGFWSEKGEVSWGCWVFSVKQQPGLLLSSLPHQPGLPCLLPLPNETPGFQNRLCFSLLFYCPSNFSLMIVRLGAPPGQSLHTFIKEVPPLEYAPLLPTTTPPPTPCTHSVL